MNLSLSPACRVRDRHILVTGGAGYLGSVLVPQLLERGYEVTVVDLFIFGAASLAALAGHPNLHVRCADIAETNQLSGVYDGIDAVVHLASVSNDPTSDLDPNLTIRTNYLATSALAEEARAAGVQQLIFMSSCMAFSFSLNSQSMAMTGRPQLSFLVWLRVILLSA